MHKTHHQLRMLLTAAKDRLQLLDAMLVVTRNLYDRRITAAQVDNLNEYYTRLWQEKEWGFGADGKA
jgi:hypothetical protein